MARSGHLLVLGLYVLLSLLFLNPLSLHLARGLTDDVDPLLNTWILAWDHHALVNEPLHLFQANLFAPYPDALAYSENLLGGALLTLPVALATGLPVLSHNLTLLLGFVLGGYGGYLLGRQATKDLLAAFLVGVIFAFNSYRLSVLPKVQMTTMAAFPLAVLYLWRTVYRGCRRDALLFAFFLWWQAASSIYYGYFTALAMALLAPLFLIVQRRHRLHRLATLAAASGLALIAFLPLALPYVRVARTVGLQRTLADALPFAASLRQWLLVPPNHLLYGGLLALPDTPTVGPYPIDSLFPGFLVTGLAVVGLVGVRGSLWRWAAALLALAGFILSVGPFLQVEPLRVANDAIALPYTWLYAHLPGFAALRAPARFAGVAMLGVALLAGLGLCTLQQRGLGKPLAVLLTGMAFLEALVWPATSYMPVPQGADIPAVYQWLAEQPPGRVVELPAALPQGQRLRERWLWPQYYSIYHWHDTPLGYSGFVPPRHVELTDLLNRFPDADAWRLLRALAVRYLVLHRAYYDAVRWAAIERSLREEGMTWAWQDEGTAVVRVEGTEPLARVAAVSLVVPPDATLGGRFAPLLVLEVAGGRLFLPGTLARGTVEWARGGRLWQQAAVVEALPFLADGRVALLLPTEGPMVEGTYEVTVRLAEPVVAEARAAVQVQDAAPSVQPMPIALRDVAFTCDGDALQVTLTWQAVGWIDRLQTVYVHLLDEGGTRLSQVDELLSPAPTRWLPAVPVTTTHRLAVPANVGDGPLSMTVGLYQWSDRFATIIPSQFFDAAGQFVLAVTGSSSSRPICRKPS